MDSIIEQGIIRRDKIYRDLQFMFISDGELNCYCQSEGHSTSLLGYLLDNTKKVKMFDEDVIQFKKHLLHKGYKVKEVIKEIGSGVNDRRTKLIKLLIGC